ncbi:MAG: PD40 domain-containing protein [Myxococcales bacterium]|nr:PD40 domain-containing protein [Myxococcales bacterium]
MIVRPSLRGLGFALGLSGCVLGNPLFGDGGGSEGEVGGASTGVATTAASAASDSGASASTGGTTGASEGSSGATTSASGDPTAASTSSTSGVDTSGDPTTITTTTAADTDATTGGDPGPPSLCGLPFGAWQVGPPELVLSANTSYAENDPVLLADGKTLFFSSTSTGNEDSFRVERAGPGLPFGPRIDNATPYGLNSPFSESKVELTNDGLEVVIASNVLSGGAAVDILWGTRAGLGDPFANLQYLPAIEPWAEADLDPHLSDDGLRLYFARRFSDQIKHLDLMVSERPGPMQPFGAPTAIAELNTPDFSEANPTLSDDQRTIIFAATSAGKIDLFVATREDPSGPFSAPVPLAEVNTPDFTEAEPYLAETGGTCELFFTSNRPGGAGNSDIYRASIIAI